MQEFFRGKSAEISTNNWRPQLNVTPAAMSIFCTLKIEYGGLTMHRENDTGWESLYIFTVKWTASTIERNVYDYQKNNMIYKGDDV